jgi:carboxyl-terminal processing protease
VVIRRRIVLGSVLVVLFGIGWVAGRGSARAGDLYQNLDLFVEILHRVQENYVDPVEPEKLINGAMKGMLRDLDPYSQFLDAGSYQNLQATTHGAFGGIGVEVSIRDDYPTVISPIEGSPAWTLGIRSGDIISRIEGKSAAGLTIDEVAQRLRGPQGSHVQISIRREGEDGEVEYAIERREIVTKSVRHAFVVEGHVGYVRLANFSETSGSEVRAALERLKAEGADRLVLDLRSNPGGLLDQAVDVAEQFVKQGTKLVSTRGRARGQDNLYFASEARPLLDWPMVVLVDGASASASEIVAGSLQDLDRALVVGQTTFGKGSVQSVFPLRERTVALKLTTARYYTPSGRSIHKTGPTPPLTAELAEDEGGESDDTPAHGPAAARSDSTRPAFRTSSGRIVYGGGGIRPDVEIARDTLPPLTNRVEGRGLAFRFANRWINTHTMWRASEALTPELWKDFADFLTAEKVPFSEGELTAERPLLSRSLRREIARRLGGDAAATRVALEGDPAFERALQVLSRARTAREVFAYAGTPASRRSVRPGREPATVR